MSLEFQLWLRNSLEGLENVKDFFAHSPSSFFTKGFMQRSLAEGTDVGDRVSEFGTPGPLLVHPVTWNAL